MDVETLVHGLGRQYLELSSRVMADHFAEKALHLTTLSLLVERRIISIDEIERTSTEICRNPGMNDVYRSPEVAARLKFVVDLLREVHERQAKGAAPTWTPRVIDGGVSDVADKTADRDPPA